MNHISIQETFLIIAGLLKIDTAQLFK